MVVENGLVEKKMNTKLRLYLIIGGILAIIILIAIVYIYLTMGIEGLYIAFFSAVIIFTFLLWVATESKKPKREPTLNELEEKRAYHQRTGELKAEEDMRRNKQRMDQRRKKKKNPLDLIRDRKFF